MGGQEQDQAIACIWSMDFNILCIGPISSFNFEGKINCGLHLFYVLCGWMASGWFLNVRTLGVALCAMGKMVGPFDLIQSNLL